MYCHWRSISLKYCCILNVFILILFSSKMQLMNYKKKRENETCICISYFVEKSFYMNSQYSIYLFYVFIVA